MKQLIQRTQEIIPGEVATARSACHSGRGTGKGCSDRTDLGGGRQDCGTEEAHFYFSGARSVKK